MMRSMQEVIAMVSQGLKAVKAMVGFWFEARSPEEAVSGPGLSAADQDRLREERDRMILSQMPR